MQWGSYFTCIFCSSEYSEHSIFMHQPSLNWYPVYGTNWHAHTANFLIILHIHSQVRVLVFSLKKHYAFGYHARIQKVLSEWV